MLGQWRQQSLRQVDLENVAGPNVLDRAVNGRLIFISRKVAGHAWSIGQWPMRRTESNRFVCRMSRWFDFSLQSSHDRSHGAGSGVAVGHDPRSSLPMIEAHDPVVNADGQVRHGELIELGFGQPFDYSAKCVAEQTGDAALKWRQFSNPLSTPRKAARYASQWIIAIANSRGVECAWGRRNIRILGKGRSQVAAIEENQIRQVDQMLCDVP
jgi:hypothetical protein